MEFVRSMFSTAVNSDQGQYDPGTPLAGLVFVVNETSCAGRAASHFAKFEAALLAAARDKGLLKEGDRLAVERTSGPRDAVDKTRRALEGGARGIVAVGGDGTLSECVQGFFQGGANAFPGAVLGYVPCGTGGDFRRTLGWDAGVAECVRRVLEPSVEPLDVGHVRMRQQGGWVDGSGDAYFVNVSSVGSSAVIARIANESPKALGGHLTFWQASVRGMLQHRPQALRFRSDGGEWEEVEGVNCLAVCNGRYFGGGMQVAPGADPRDGQFDVTIWAGFGILDFVLLSGQIYSGKHVAHPKTRTFRCSCIEVEAAGGGGGGGVLPVELDGEGAAGRTPESWRVVPKGMRFLS